MERIVKMKMKDGFLLRNVSDAYVVVAVGEAAKNFNGMITLNETGAFLWEALTEGCADKKALVDKLLAEYDVDTALVRAKAVTGRVAREIGLEDETGIIDVYFLTLLEHKYQSPYLIYNVL